MKLINHKAKMFFTVLIGVALINFPVMATDVGGIIDTDKTWDLAGSPYNITSDVQVADGVTLTVDPGVVISNGALRVWGTLSAIGTNSSKIVFNSINIVSESVASIVNFEYSELNGGTIYLDDGSMILEDSKINNLSSFVMNWPTYDASVERNVFVDSSGILVQIKGGVNVYIRNNLFFNQSNYAVRSATNDFGSEIIIEYNSFYSTDKIALSLDGGASYALMSGVNNFWNTTNTDVIDGMIFDRNDDLECDGYIAYIPFLTEPHPDTPSLPTNEICISNSTDLQSALTNAASNSRDDVIQIVQGTYNGNFVYASTETYGVTIEGGYLAGCGSRVVDSTNTVLDAQYSGRVLSLSAPDATVNFTVSGLSIQNGNYNYVTGGLYVNTSSGNFNLSHSTIHNNSMGGFFIQTGIVNISNTIISSNHSLKGQVILADEADVSDSLIIQNHSENVGGGLQIISDNITLRRNTITGNISDNGIGGGVNLEGNTIQLSNNNISQNLCLRYAGGGVLASASIINVINNIIEYNHANNEGGGIKIIGGIAILRDNIISHNDSETGGGVDLRISDRANLVNNIIKGNTALGGGGGLWFNALHLSSPSCTLANNTIVSNESPKGGGVYILLETDTSRAEIFNNIIIGNGYGIGHDLYLENDRNGNSFPSPINLFNNDFDQSEAGTYIQIPFPIDPSNLNNEDPLFDFDGYHLTNSSPCIDAGTPVNAPDDDIDGDLRPQGYGYDIGADEYTALNLDIRANNSDGPVDLPIGEILSITIALDPGDYTGYPADWWCVADAPFGWYYYNAGTENWLKGFHVSYQGPLGEVSPPLEILNTSDLPIGSYTFYFGVDGNKNGNFDNPLYYDRVEASVVFPAPVRWTNHPDGRIHYYEIITNEDGFDWNDAKIEAENRTYSGYSGYLATITSQEEQDFIESNFQFSEYLISPGGVALGGYQDPWDSPPADNWHWVTGEEWNYTHWASGEPNDHDWGPGTTEDALMIWLNNGDKTFYWNDFPRSDYNQFHYMVEYSQ